MIDPDQPNHSLRFNFWTFKTIALVISRLVCPKLPTDQISYLPISANYFGAPKLEIFR